jgi:hypothetical protein
VKIKIETTQWIISRMPMNWKSFAKTSICGFADNFFARNNSYYVRKNVLLLYFPLL